MTSPVFGANLVDQFMTVAAGRDDAPFLWAKSDGAFRAWSWRRVADETKRLAHALGAMGLKPGDRVALVSENRPEWTIADLAIMTAGGITVPAYTSNTPADHAYILTHSGAKAVIFSGRALARKLLPALNDAPGVGFVVFMEPLEDASGLPVTALHWPDALALGARQGGTLPGEGLTAEDVACLIYTSGTGGRPKGVMLSHKNIQANIRGICDVLGRCGGGPEREVFLSFLPLSHSYEHTCGQFFPVAIGAEIYYAEGVEHLASSIAEVRPTIMMCVPRLHEVLRQKMVARVNRQGGPTKRLFRLAVDLGRKRLRGERLGPFERAADAAADLLVRRRVRKQFGGRLKALVSGGAPLNADVGGFFMALGLPVLQGYGQTESAPLVSVNLPESNTVDTVGPPILGSEVRIAEDGEILVRGDSVMRGYWRDDEATEEALKDGWLHTGDVGRFDKGGRLVITDRKKDLIVNSGGDNISPQRVEGVLALRSEIGQALVYGDRRPHLVALIVPAADFVRAFAKEKDVEPDLALLAGNPEFRKAVGEAIKGANQHLSGIEKVRKFHVLPEPFTVENGLMTPTMKLRRPAIRAAFQDLLDGLYAAGR